uniref:BHLH domain-containing protein n=1 Tax=Plectus sambesii TaxID=2011161 RepID=A0A914XJI7_9BILA
MDDDFSDDDSLQDGQHSHTTDSFSPGIDENRRAHHNALERKRRDHIKDSFSSLKEVVPTLVGERSSRALILKKAVDYISTMQDKISSHENDINALKSQNEQLESQIRAFEGSMTEEEEEEESART